MPYSRWLPSGSWRNLPDRSTPTSAAFFEHLEDSLEAISAVADAASGAGVTDGDKGDVTVAGSGADWTVNASHAGTTHAAVQAAAEATAAADATTKANTAEANAIATAAADATTKANTAESNAEATAANADNITSGTLAVARTHADIARVTQVTTAVSDHAAAVDPHGDRAYTDDEIVNLPSPEPSTLLGPDGNPLIAYALSGSPPSQVIRPSLNPTAFWRTIATRTTGPQLDTSAAATSLLDSTIIPAANSISVGDWLRFVFIVTCIQNVSASQTLILRFRVGASNAYTTGAMVMAPQSASPKSILMEVQCLVTAAGTGTLFGVAGSARANGVLIAGVATDQAVDLTDWSADAFDLTGQHDTASASMATNCIGFSVEQLQTVA